jgi:hypothetical protein
MDPKNRMLRTILIHVQPKAHIVHSDAHERKLDVLDYGSVLAL